MSTNDAPDVATGGTPEQPAVDPSPVAPETAPAEAPSIEPAEADPNIAQQFYDQFRNPQTQGAALDRMMQTYLGTDLSTIQQAIQLQQAIGDADPAQIANLVQAQRDFDADPRSGLDEGEELSPHDLVEYAEQKARGAAEERFNELVMNQHTNNLRMELDAATKQALSGLNMNNPQDALKARYIKAHIDSTVGEQFQQRGMEFMPAEVRAIATQARSEFDTLFNAPVSQQPATPNTLPTNQGQPSTPGEVDELEQIAQAAAAYDLQRRGG